ncbi:heterokaryon incompatibility protein-domain-containing protein [Ilyonectria destructans]|nr:heterokaryon incompatibility protein-domain-containing protein [Ilyonectria destructans]
MEAYQYSPLPPRNIRLLHLHTGSGDDELIAELRTLPLETAAIVEFSALSYAWGDPLPRKRIICSGRAVEIGPSLHNALVNIRSRQYRRLIWADALCINQNDTAERASQVRLMGEIYSAAATTVIWLGGESDSVGRAFEFLRKFDLVYSRKSTSLPVGDTRTPHKPEVELIPAAFAPDPLSAARDIGTLLQQSWFSRKWILQELAKSSSPILVAGTKSLHWTFLASWLNYGMDHPRTFWYFEAACPRGADGSPESDSDSQLPTWYQRACILASLKDRQESLCDLLNTTFLFNCSDSRDHIIALLGLASDVSSSDLKLLVDYNIPGTELYRRFARFCIRNSRSLTILWSFINGISPDHHGALESWIPNIKHAPRSPHPVGSRLGVLNWTHLHAAGDSSLQASVDGQAGYLSIRGRIVDVIDSMGMTPNIRLTKLPDPRIFMTESLRKYASQVHHWLKDCESVTKVGNGTNHPANNGEKEFISAILSHFSHELSQEASESFRRYRAFIEAICEAKPFADVQEEVDGILVENMCRRFGASRKGSVGWVPKCANVEDVVCVFDGMSIPYVLRLGTEGRYRLVGEGYMTGLMAGEATELTDCEARDIVLE